MGRDAAARLVRDGKVFRLDAKLGFADPPLFGRIARGRANDRAASRGGAVAAPPAARVELIRGRAVRFL